MSDFGFSDHPAAVILFFLGYPAVISEKISDHPAIISANKSDHPIVIWDAFADHPNRYQKLSKTIPRPSFFFGTSDIPPNLSHRLRCLGTGQLELGPVQYWFMKEISV